MAVKAATADTVYEPVPFWAKVPHGLWLKEATSVAVDADDRVYVFNQRDRPKPSMATPESRERTSPAGVSFSISTRTVRAATHARFITPTANSTIINAQQQPRQKRP